MNHKIPISDISIGDGTLLLIAGPCVIEPDGGHPWRSPRPEGLPATGMPLIFKASYDKANRTSLPRTGVRA